jgi:uncharacterized protein
MLKPDAGAITWIDLTAGNADEVKAFYQRVVGWTAEPVEMGGYSDFNMLPPGAERPVAGICHARGTNAGLPAHWLIYIIVADLDASVGLCNECGGEVLTPIKCESHGRIAVIRDPAGAVCALYEPAPGR